MSTYFLRKDALKGEKESAEKSADQSDGVEREFGDRCEHDAGDDGHEREIDLREEKKRVCVVRFDVLELCSLTFHPGLSFRMIRERTTVKKGSRAFFFIGNKKNALPCADSSPKRIVSMLP